MSVTKAHERHDGPRESRTSSGAGPVGPGKRTLSEELGAGVGLPAEHRANFERSLGRDLSGVRLHTSDAAANEADKVDARAFTRGQDIMFGRGLNPFDWRSQHLLAHEVAHTAQQQGAAPSSELATTQPGDGAERNADAAAAAMLAGRPATVAPQPMAIARRTKNERVDEPAAEPAGDGGAVGDGGAPGAPGSQTGGGSTPGAASNAEIGELTANQVGAEP